MANVQQLWVYPFKSGRGISKQNVTCEAEGIREDRRLMAVDAYGKFLTARQTPALLQLSCIPQAKGWQLTHPQQAEAYWLDAAVLQAGDDLPCTIWKDNAWARDGGDAVAQWLSDALGEEVRLAIWEPQARQAGKYDLPMTFADAAPLLLTSAASVEQVCAWSGLETDVRRFRPNIVLEDVTAFAEDNWQQVRIGNTLFQVLDTCTRCILTTRDPESGIEHPAQEPLRSLLAHHSDAQQQPILGVNIVMADPTTPATLQVGDTVEIVA